MFRRKDKLSFSSVFQGSPLYFVIFNVTSESFENEASIIGNRFGTGISPVNALSSTVALKVTAITYFHLKFFSREDLRNDRNFLSISLSSFSLSSLSFKKPCKLRQGVSLQFARFDDLSHRTVEKEKKMRKHFVHVGKAVEQNFGFSGRSLRSMRGDFIEWTRDSSSCN